MEQEGEEVIHDPACGGWSRALAYRVKLHIFQQERIPIFSQRLLVSQTLSDSQTLAQARIDRLRRQPDASAQGLASRIEKLCIVGAA